MRAGDEHLPIDPEVNKSLTSVFKQKYGYPLHPTQEYTSQLVSAMYRGLKRRAGGQAQAKPARGLYTLKERQKLAEPQKRKPPLTTNFALLDKSVPDDEEDPHYNSNKSPWLFLVALEAMPRTPGESRYLLSTRRKG